jgi:serine protease Do
MNRRFILDLRAIAVAIALTACSPGTQAQREQADEPARPSRPAATRNMALPDFARLVEEYGNAVVFVEVLQQRQRTGPFLSPEDPMFDFFRRFGIPLPDMPEQRELPPARGAGSGFIVSKDGYILTNAHVVADADSVTVRLSDRREFQAKVVGADARTDVAVLKIDANNLPVVRIGDPNELKPGQWVLAIGSPFGLENSVTAGIVSATSRAVGGGDSYVPFIQTDVAVNPGNSGGPLFNLDGEVVGINSMIFSRTGGYMGLSFAIPIDVAINVRDQLIETGRVVRGRIGVAVQDVNAQLAESFGLDRPRGALVSSVDEDGPAADAGIRPGDVILAVDGQQIERFGELSTMIARMKPGTQAKLRIWRDRRERELTVRIGEMEDTAPTRGGRPGSEEGAGQLGMIVRPLTNEEKQRLDTEGNIVVERVTDPAASAGVRPGDVILGISGERVQNVRELREALEDAKGSVALLIQRGNAQIFIPIRVR